MKRKILVVSLLTIIGTVNADQFRITNGDPECTSCNGVTPNPSTDVGVFLDERGNFFQEGETLGRLDFAPTGVVNNNSTNIRNNQNTITNNRDLIEQLFINQEGDVINENISSQFSALENKLNNTMAVNSAVEFMSPTDSGKTKVNLGAASINTDAQALGLTIVGTYYWGPNYPKLSYGIGGGTNIGNGTFDENIFKGHFGFEF